MSIRGDVVSIEALMSRHYFLPAAVQRDYQWQTPQCLALIGDFDRAWRPSDVSPAHHSGFEGSNGLMRGPEYFLGSFVFLPQSDGRLQIFDGLQRLTTLTILFAVLRDLLEVHDQTMTERLSRLVLDAGGRPRLVLANADPTLETLIQTKSESVRTRRNLSANSLRGRLLSAAGLFHARLKMLPLDQVSQFSDFVLSTVYAGLIEVNDDRIARQIFITTNNRGISLNEADVLKSQVNAIPVRQDLSERVLRHWAQIKGKFDSETDYRTFLETIDFVTRRAGRSSQGLAALGDHLQKQYSELQFVDWLVDLERYADAWLLQQALLNEPKKSETLGAALLRLSVFEWPEWRGPALLLMRQFDNATIDRDKRRKKHLRGRLDALQRACLVETLLETAEVDRIRKFAKAMSDVSADRNPASHALQITPEIAKRVDEVLKAPAFDDQTTRQVLRWLELSETRNPTIDILKSVPQRVLPAQIEEGSEWERQFPGVDERWGHAHAWGNLVLRAETDSAQRASSDFRDWKKQASSDRPQFSLLHEVTKRNDWTAREISVRSTELRARIMRQLATPLAPIDI